MEREGVEFMCTKKIGKRDPVYENWIVEWWIPIVRSEFEKVRSVEKLG